MLANALLRRRSIGLASTILIAALASSSAIGATLTVTATTDSGAGSLRNALASAGVGDTIVFSGAGIGTHVLASPLPTIASSVTIDGGQYGSVAIDGNNASRLFVITAGTVTLRNLRLQKGFSTGGNGGFPGGGGGLGAGGCIFIGGRSITPGAVGVWGRGGGGGKRGGGRLGS